MDTDDTKGKKGQQPWHQQQWQYENLPWKAWGSWFSWGSPVGLSIFLCSLLISVGTFLYLLHLAGLL